MTQLNFVSGIAIEGMSIVPQGKQILWRDGMPIWCGDLGSPIEDVEFDRMSVNPADFERIVEATKDERARAEMERRTR